MPPSFRFQTPVCSFGAKNLTVEQNLTPDLPLEKLHLSSARAYQKKQLEFFLTSLEFSIIQKIDPNNKSKHRISKAVENPTWLLQMFFTKNNDKRESGIDFESRTKSP